LTPEVDKPKNLNCVENTPKKRKVKKKKNRIFENFLLWLLYRVEETLCGAELGPQRSFSNNKPSQQLK
jgi:hypothetical protein